MNLEINEARAEQFTEIEGTALKIMQDYLGGDRQGGDEIKMAMQMLNVVSKNRQTTTAREALRFNMVDSLDDETIRRKYVTATQPGIRKLLPKSRERKGK
ncbi:MAG TPA: hypothetical protein VMW24_28645 [Sedimentisphaerales bacterium]|nr:hypothetical protein [Sedimentisphaerales bacterium]